MSRAKTDRTPGAARPAALQELAAAGITLPEGWRVQRSSSYDVAGVPIEGWFYATPPWQPQPGLECTVVAPDPQELAVRVAEQVTKYRLRNGQSPL